MTLKNEITLRKSQKLSESTFASACNWITRSVSFDNTHIHEEFAVVRLARKFTCGNASSAQEATFKGE